MEIYFCLPKVCVTFGKSNCVSVIGVSYMVFSEHSLFTGESTMTTGRYSHRRIVSLILRRIILNYWHLSCLILLDWNLFIDTLSNIGFLILIF